MIDLDGHESTTAGEDEGGFAGIEDDEEESWLGEQFRNVSEALFGSWVNAVNGEASGWDWLSNFADLSGFKFVGLAGTAIKGVKAGKAVEKVKNVTKSVSGPANSVNAQSALASKLRSVEKAHSNAAKVRNMPDGSTRYYTKEVLATKQGPTRGASYVTEYNPKTGQTRSWMESYDDLGNVVRVHPKSINGQRVSSPHYPPTGREVNQ